MLFIFVACNGEDEIGETEHENIEQSLTIDPQLEDIPDIVATVNGEEITKEFFALYYVPTLKRTAEQHAYQEEEEGSNEEQLRQQIQSDTLDLLIEQQLLLQEAEARNISVDEEIIQRKIHSLMQQYDSEEEFEKALEEDHFTMEDLEEDLTIQVTIQELVEEEVKKTDIQEEEIKQLYENFVENEEEAPSFEEVQPQLEQQILQQRRYELRQALVEKLREEGEIEVFL